VGYNDLFLGVHADQTKHDFKNCKLVKKNHEKSMLVINDPKMHCGIAPFGKGNFYELNKVK